MTDLRRNDDLDVFMGITPQTVTPNGPVPKRPEPPLDPRRTPEPPRVGVLVLASPPRPIDPAKIRQGAIKVLHSMALLRPEVRQAILECALRMDRA